LNEHDTGNISEATSVLSAYHKEMNQTITTCL